MVFSRNFTFFLVISVWLSRQADIAPFRGMLLGLFFAAAPGGQPEWLKPPVQEKLNLKGHCRVLF